MLFPRLHPSVPIRFANIAALALGMGAMMGGCGRSGDRPAEPEAAEAVPATPGVPAVLEGVLGRWVREDGGYVLEVRGGGSDGTLEAGYFNPAPITVSRAAWIKAGDRLQLFVELTGSGYDGSTYVLHHEPQRDRLVGEYRQAVQGQTYQIEFARERAP